ncbi:MAG: geranylgeranyl reductase family protein [Candidatus Hodarchaeota archaeon]
MKKSNDSREDASSDIIIIGASIAGNYLAYLLKDSGLNIRVFEEHKSVGQPLECAGIVSSKLSKIMRVPNHLVLNRVSSAKIFGPVGKSISMRTKDKPLVIDRVGLDKHYYKKAREGGVIYHLGEKVIDIKDDKDHVLVKTKGGLFKASMIVGCDGANSLVAHKKGIKNELLVGKQVIVEVNMENNPHGLSTDECELHFNPRWNNLFGWVIPIEKNKFRIGLASRKNVSRHFKDFIQDRFKDTIDNIEGKDFKVINTTGGTLPVGLLKNAAFNRMILLGDSCCQVKATTGGGVVMLAIAAKYAANTIIAAFKRRNFSKAFLLKHYQGKCRDTIGFTLKIHYVIHLGLRVLNRSDFTFLFSLAHHPAIKKKLMQSADMDFPLAFLLKILLYPKFYAWLSKFLIRNLSVLKKTLIVLLGNKEASAD